MSKKIKEKSKLERDRREVDYIMKKMARESRKDNDWRDNDNIFCHNIVYSYNIFEILNGVELGVGNSFNQVYFNTKENAQKCLNYLLKTYSKEKLTKIWGVK